MFNCITPCVTVTCVSSDRTWIGLELIVKMLYHTVCNHSSKAWYMEALKVVSYFFNYPEQDSNPTPAYMAGTLTTKPP